MKKLSSNEYWQRIKFFKWLFQETIKVRRSRKNEFAYEVIRQLTEREFTRVMYAIQAMGLIVEIIPANSSFSHPICRLWTNPVSDQVYLRKSTEHTSPSLLFIIDPRHCPPELVPSIEKAEDDIQAYRVLFDYFNSFLMSKKNIDLLKKYELSIP